MRLVYMDESGVANAKQEGFLVVAGVLVDADKEWRLAEKELKDISKTLMPEGQFGALLFHGMHLFSGGGNFPRENWPKGLRWDVLERVAEIVPRLQLTLAIGWLERNRIDKFALLPPKEKLAMEQAHAFMFCMVAVEQYLRENCEEGEVALVIAEDTPHARQQIKDAQEYLQSNQAWESWPAITRPWLPLKRVIDTVHFAEKARSPLLQLADVGAFIMRRALSEKPEHERFVRALTGQYMPIRDPRHAGGCFVVGLIRARLA